MRILIAGASGFLGTRLVDTLRTDGHDVHRLVRRAPRSADESRWDPARGQVDPAAVAAADAVVNLAGANINGRRWTAAYKKVLVDSRVDTTSTLATAIAAAERRPAVLLNASGIHVYGDCGDRAVDEQDPPGTGFLADLCREWEAATAPADDAGVRVVHLRTSFPLDREGGFLKPLLLVFKLGGGGKLAGGRQYMPWISLPDWLGATTMLLERGDIAGPVNLTGPEPATNAEFTEALGRAVHRPTLLPVPAFALRAALGELGDWAVASLRATPGVLTKAGYAFRHRSVASAVRWAVEHSN
jgi:uncharacterized protein (TIGR01777 family)